MFNEHTVHQALSAASWPSIRLHHALQRRWPCSALLSEPPFVQATRRRASGLWPSGRGEEPRRLDWQRADERRRKRRPRGAPLECTGSSFHSNLLYFLRSLKKGRPLSPSRLMNLLKAAMHPVSFIGSFLLLGGFMYLMALTFMGLASMPRLLTMKPSSFPDGTPNTHLVRLSFHLNF